LGLGSGDIDLSVDIMSGAAFCGLLERHLASLPPSSLAEMGIKGLVDPVAAPEAFSAPDSQTTLAPASPQSLQTPSRSTPKSPLCVTLTKLNPQQSKHLETAIVTLYGLELNFAQLRTDIYDNQSRIPQIKRASATEDAFRRDFTINALFYNILTDKIEDLTGSGIRSILNQEIKTPLPPLETLKDDPLRALRALRFAARFGFSIHPDLHRCIADPHVHLLLLTKVTPPRVGVEIQKMLSPLVSHIPTSPSNHSHSNQNLGVVVTAERYNNPLQALHLLVDTGLYVPALNPVSWQKSAHPTTWTTDMAERGLLLCDYLYHIFAEVDEHRAEVNQTISPQVRSALLAMTFLLPLLGNSYHDFSKLSHRDKVPWIGAFKHSLQYPLSNVFSTAQALAGSSTVLSLLDRMLKSPEIHLPPSSQKPTHLNLQGSTNQNNTQSEVLQWSTQEQYANRFTKALELEPYREEVGMWLRSAPSFWRSMVLLTKLFRPTVASNLKPVPKEFSAGWLLEEFPLELGFIDAIEQTQMERARTVTLCFNGHQLSKMLSLPSGPKVGSALDMELRYQVSHLDASEAEVRDFLKKRFNISH
jgi:hypothetical protein